MNRLYPTSYLSDRNSRIYMSRFVIPLSSLPVQYSRESRRAMSGGLTTVGLKRNALILDNELHKQRAITKCANNEVGDEAVSGFKIRYGDSLYGMYVWHVQYDATM